MYEKSYEITSISKKIIDISNTKAVHFQFCILSFWIDTLKQARSEGKKCEYQPLRIVVLYSSGHLGSNIVLNQVLKMKCFEVVGIVKANIVDFSPKVLKTFIKNIKELAFWIQLNALLATIHSSNDLRLIKATFRQSQTTKNQFQPFRLYTNLSLQKNINDSSCRAFIKNSNPDLVVSAYFHQILKKDTLAIPSKGTLNIHPGYLPLFKGSMNFSCNATQKAKGVSVHWMDEGIDTGEILARKSFKIKPCMTQESTMVKTAFIGASLLKRIGKTLVKQKTPKVIRVSKIDRKRYYKMPKRKHFLVYQSKYRFFRIRDIFGLLIWRPIKAQGAIYKKRQKLFPLPFDKLFGFSRLDLLRKPFTRLSKYFLL